jgi:tRNA(Met) cytidine acetyltransferase
MSSSEEPGESIGIVQESQHLRLSREEIENIAVSAIESSKEMIGKEEINLVRRIKSRQAKCLKNNYRQMIVLSGGSPELQGLLAGVIVSSISRFISKERGGEVSVLYMYHDEFDSSRIRKETFRLYMKKTTGKKEGVNRVIDVYEKTDRYLGTTFDVLVLDLNDDLKPNDIGRLVEIVRGGGLIVLLVPEWSLWDSKLTIFKQKLLVPGFNEPRHVFIKWFKFTMTSANNVVIYNVVRKKVIYAGKIARPLETSSRNIVIPKETVFPEELYKLALTQDQVEFLKLVEELFAKPFKAKKIALVVTADRGRGKSCALGIALVGLAIHYSKFRNKVRILLTAPEPGNVASLFSLTIRAAVALGIELKVFKKEGYVVEVKTDKFSIEYWRPLDIPRINGDIIAVDEASGIHVPQLHRVFESHDKVIFTATIHGYEGAGRGFSIRFLGELRNRSDVFLREYHMETPIRYGEGDPIESWLYRALLLNAEPAELDENDIKAIREGYLQYEEVSPEELFTDKKEKDLRELFGIYVLAHYRNQPDDLGLLADAPHHLVRSARTSTGKILGALQIAVEGGLDENTIYSLLRGNKVPGNIIPDRILKHLRLWEAGKTVGYRIVRIATHPKVQSMGIGSFLLKQLINEARIKGLDWVGSGFGVNSKLLNFWLKNGFVPIHMSPDRNPVSGEYTLLVIHPLSETARKIIGIGASIFLEKLIYSLRDTYRDLELDVAYMLLTSINSTHPRPLEMNPINIDRLWIYSYGPMTYEAVSDVMYKLACYYFMHRDYLNFRLSELEEKLLIAKVLQGRDWELVSKELSIGDTKAMLMLKEVASKFLLFLFNKDIGSEIGLFLNQLGGG